MLRTLYYRYVWFELLQKTCVIQSGKFCKNVELTLISDQPRDVKPEPVFTWPEKVAGPDPVDFNSYCSVSDYAVGTDGDELVSPTISSASSQILPLPTPKLLSESAAAPRLSNVRNSLTDRYNTVLIKYPNYIKQITINRDGFPPIRRDYIAEKK